MLRSRSSGFKSLDEADAAVALTGPDLASAVGSFLGAEAQELHNAAAADTGALERQEGAGIDQVADASLRRLLAKLETATQEAEASFQPMRGLLKKRGGAARFSKVTWHWRFCVLHRHALAIHDGRDRPLGLRSAIPLKHVSHVDRATPDECGDRAFAFAVRTDLDGGRAWIFCCMGEAELDEWLRCLHAACALTHGSGLSNALQAS